MMKNNLIAMAIAASMSAMQREPAQLATAGHQFMSGGNNFNRHQAKNKSYRPKSASKYKSHQGKQECARRLKVGTAAYYSAQCL